MTNKARVLLASAMAMMGPAMAAVLSTQELPSTRQKRSQHRPQANLGMTEEQREWNRAVDARKAAKKGR